MSIADFLSWHYFQGTKNVLEAWVNFIGLAFHLFSVKLLLKTLFSPWRRVEIRTAGKGFSLDKFFSRLTFNLISRAIGFFVRTIFIIFGVWLALFFFILGPPFFISWLFLSPLTWICYWAESTKLKLDPKSLKDDLLFQAVRGKAEKFVYQRLGVAGEEELRQIPPEDIREVLIWHQGLEKLKAERRKFWRKENLFRLKAFGTDLAFGYTPELDKYCQDLSFPPPFSHQLVGRERQIRQIEAVLTRSSQTNILLIGEAGVGKHTILLGLAKAIREKRADPRLFYKRVLLLDMSLLLGQAGLTEASKAKFDLILQEAEGAGNVILVVDQIERYVSGEIGTDLTAVFSHAIRSAKIQIIGVTTPEHFEKYIFQNEQFLKYFEKVEVEAQSKKEALHILERILPDFERGRKVRVTYQALKEIVEQSEKFITHIPFPEKAIDLLDQVVNESESRKQKLAGKKEVDQLISEKVKVPVGALSQAEITKLKNLDKILHRRIVDQEQAVSALVKAMQRTRVDIAEEDKPIGSFLFLGPTGVGKTETAKALAEAYFGSEKQMIRFDMSQPFHLDFFVKEARENPYGVLLLDEFEKAPPDVLHLFLTVFDEGYLKDKEGKTVSYKEMIIICTSNAGAEFVRQQARQGQPAGQIIEHVLQKGIFSPELINRFDGVIIFSSLTKTQAGEIAEKMIVKLQARLKRKEVVLQEIDPEVYDLMVQKGYSLEFGARPMKRLIADKIESLIAKKILDAEIKKHDRIKLTLDSQTKDFKIEKV